MADHGRSMQEIDAENVRKIAESQPNDIVLQKWAAARIKELKENM